MEQDIVEVAEFEQPGQQWQEFIKHLELIAIFGKRPKSAYRPGNDLEPKTYRAPQRTIPSVRAVSRGLAACGAQRGLGISRFGSAPRELCSRFR